MTIFVNLVRDLKRFQVTDRIFSENELEQQLKEFLESKQYCVERQKIVSGFRNDLIVSIFHAEICLELKVNADLSCSKQLDKYLSYYNNGIILVCWKSSTNLKSVFEKVKDSIEIPVELVEIRNNMSLV